MSASRNVLALLMLMLDVDLWCVRGVFVVQGVRGGGGGMAWEARSPHDGRAKHRMWAALPLCAVRAGLATRFLRRELARGAPRTETKVRTTQSDRPGAPMV